MHEDLAAPLCCDAGLMRGTGLGAARGDTGAGRGGVPGSPEHGVRICRRAPSGLCGDWWLKERPGGMAACPSADETPLHAREPPVGEPKVFLELPHKGKMWSWEAVRVLAWEPVFHKGVCCCWTTVKVTRRIWRDYVGGHQESELPIHPSVHFATSGPRLKIRIDGKHVSLAQVAAFCWNRSGSCGEDLQWSAFRAGPYHSHHLPDRDLRTRPDTVGAGWVAALTKTEHEKEHHWLDAARLARDRVLWLEAEERRAEQLERSFRALARARKRRPGTTLASIAARRTGAEDRRSVVGAVRGAGQVLLATWDIDFGCVAGGGPAIAELDQNPYLVHLFVEYEMGPKPFEWKRKRQALLAKCAQVAFVQAMTGETPPWLIDMAERIDKYGSH